MPEAQIKVLPLRKADDEAEATLSKLDLSEMQRARRSGGFQFFPARGWTPGAHDEERERLEEKGLPT